MKNYCRLIISIFLIISGDNVFTSDTLSVQKIKHKEDDEKISLNSSTDYSEGSSTRNALTKSQSSKYSSAQKSDEAVAGNCSFSDSENDFYSCDDDCSDNKSVSSENNVQTLPAVQLGRWFKDESDYDSNKELQCASRQLRSLVVASEEQAYQQIARHDISDKEAKLALRNKLLYSAEKAAYATKSCSKSGDLEDIEDIDSVHS